MSEVLGDLAFAAKGGAVLYRRSGSTSQRGGAMKLQILVVDDHAGSLYALSKLLASAGHTVRPAGSAGAAARVLAEQGHFDLLIADTGLAGAAALALMRQVQLRDGAPGIALTADDEEPADPTWRAAGFLVRLRKPLRFREVEAAIRKVFAEPPRQKESPAEKIGMSP